MKRLKFLAFWGSGVGALVVVAMTLTPVRAYARTLISYVMLQPSVPGSSQTGNINITGDVRAAQYFGSGENLSGVPASSLNLPISGSGSQPSGSLLYLDNTSANGWSFLGEGYIGVAGIGTQSGVQGQTNSAGGRALLGLASGPSSKGVYGEGAWSSGTTWGVYGSTNSPAGYGVEGYSLLQGTGVYGYSARGLGMIAESAMDDGIMAVAYTADKYGTYSYNTAAGGHGVVGWSMASTGNGIGVTGQATSASGYGVFSYGRTGATGTKSFVIDDPSDPENYTLSHYCSEGPEPLNVYSGNVVTNEQGYADVVLPDYFSSINRDVRYQLTVIDSSDSADFILAKVVREAKGNTFRLRTSRGEVKVSWRVEAVRNDRWVQRYGAPVRREKPANERGTYLNPELYGQPAEMGVTYRPLTHRGDTRPSPSQHAK